MADPLLIDPLDPAVYLASAEPAGPGLSQIVSDTLGDYGTDADGFVDDLVALLSLLDSIDAAFAVLGGDLITTFAEAGTIDSTELDSVTDGLVDTAVATQALTDLGVVLGMAPPSNPTGGGGTGTGGGDVPLAEPDYGLDFNAALGVQVVPFTQYTYVIWASDLFPMRVAAGSPLIAPGHDQLNSNLVVTPDGGDPAPWAFIPFGVGSTDGSGETRTGLELVFYAGNGGDHSVHAVVYSPELGETVSLTVHVMVEG